MIVILVFLLSVRATLVTAISIPTSVLITFIGIQAFGYSLNILTLGALTIAIGRVVDDSIVVIENIKRHYVGDADKMPSILRAVREVACAITASTITTVAVFLPIAFVGDVTGELFRPFALTVTIAMTASLLVALTIVPVLAYWFLRPGQADPRCGRATEVDPEAPEAPPSAPAEGATCRSSRWTLRHSWITLGARRAGAGRHHRPRAAHEDELPRRLGPEHLHGDAGLGAAPSLEAEDAASQQVEDDPAGHRRRRDRADLDRLERVCASRDAFSAAAAASPTRSRPTPTPTRSRCATRCRPPSPNSTTSATITVAGGGAASARATSRSTSPRPTPRTLQEATDAVVDGGRRRSTASAQVSSNLSASLPYIAVDGRPRRGRAARATRRSRSARSCRTRCSRSRSARSRSTTRRSRSTSRLRGPPATIDELRQLEVPSATGPIPLDDVATVEETEGPTSITTERRPAHRDGHRRRRRPTTCGSLGASVTAALADVDLPGPARRRRSAASSRSSRTRSRSSASRCSRRS